METNRIKPSDQVTTQVYDENGHEIAHHTNHGFHDIMQAINVAYAELGPAASDIRDYTFEVSNATTGTSERYRINAHGHLKLEV